MCNGGLRRDRKFPKDRGAAAESYGLSMQLKNFSFLVLLCTFEEVLGLTKSLSNQLQAKELNLSHVTKLVESVPTTLKDHRSVRHFSSHVWKKATDIALERNIDVCVPNSHK